MVFATRLIPWRYFGFLVGILIAEIVGLMMLKFYLNNLQNQIADLDNQIPLAQDELQKLMQESDVLQVLYKYLAIRSILEKKISFGDVLENLAKNMPQGMVLDSLEIDKDRKILKLSGSFDNWDLYIQTAAYFRNHSKFRLTDQGSPSLKDNKIKFNWVFNLK